MNWIWLILRAGFLACSIGGFRLSVSMFKDDDLMLGLICMSLGIISAAAFISTFI